MTAVGSLCDTHMEFAPLLIGIFLSYPCYYTTTGIEIRKSNRRKSMLSKDLYEVPIDGEIYMRRKSFGSSNLQRVTHGLYSINKMWVFFRSL